MAARIGNIAFDCEDVLQIAAFWSAVLGRPLDKGSSGLWASIGGADAARQEPAWYFNKVAEPKRAKNRVHLDLVDPDHQSSTNSCGLAPRSSATTRCRERTIAGL
jgi:hypothetical protein